MSDSYRVEGYEDRKHGKVLREKRRQKREEQRSFLKIERPEHENDQREFALNY
jgi:hypothetical protein